MSDRNSGDNFMAFLLGGIVGACLGILYAPQAGKEIRKRLQVLLEEWGEKAEDILDEGKDKVEEIVQQTKKKLEDDEEE